jgi:hypothetical protein
LFIKDNECSTNIVAYKKVYVYTTDGEEVILGISWFSLKKSLYQTNSTPI